MKKYIAIILTAMLLCSCAKDNAEVTESVTSPIETTVITEESATAQTETSATSSETTAETENTVSETETVTSETAAQSDIVPEKGEILYEYTDRNGYTFYCTKNTLYVKKDNFDIASMDITREQARLFSYDSPELQPDYYTDDMPSAVAVFNYGLTYDVYFVTDGEFRKAEWYLNGEKLDSIDYTLLKCYCDGDKFTAYSDWNYDYDKNIMISLLKHTFEFDRDNLCFNGVTESAPVSEGTATEVMERYDEFFGGLYGADDEPAQDGLLKITAEGYRTRNELTKTLSDFCTDSAAEKICSYFLDGKYSDFKEINGQLYRYEGPPNNYNSIKYLHSSSEKDGVINAVFYSYTAVQDVPYYNEFFTAEFIFDNGVWKISDIDL